MIQATKISIEAEANAPLDTVWKAWNTPEDITQWNAADPSWHCPDSENNLHVKGTFKHRMEARDGSYGFDFEGTYDEVETNKKIAYTMPDGRTVTTIFSENDGKTMIKSTFDAETENSAELQRQGWQAILNNFVNYVESNESTIKTFNGEKK